MLIRRLNKRFYVASLFIFALSFSAFWLTALRHPSKAERAKHVRGSQAIERLKQSGQYDSLMEAMNAVRRKERGQNDPEVFTASEAMPPTAKLYAPDGAPANFFGYSVDLSGETAIVGVPLDSLESIEPASVSEGSAYVFTRSGTNWALQQKLVASDGANRDYFGADVSIDGDTVIVGALFDDVGTNANQGSAYIFTRSGTVWTQQAKLTAAQGAAGDRFGVSVEISNQTVVVGSKRDQGAAYVFTRSGAVWNEQQLTPSSGASGDEFGAGVAIDADTILISAAGRSISGDDQGAVYVFTRGGGVWSEQQILTAADGAAGDRFGGDVAISGNTAIVGANFDDIGGAADQGSAYIFTRAGGAWSEQAKLLAAEGTAGDHFGSSVAISGNTAVVGAPGNDSPAPLDDTHFDAGSAYVFTGSGATWTEQAQLFQENVGGVFGDGSRFGASAAIVGETILVGISGADNEDGYAGVYVREGASWSLQAFLGDDEDEAGDEFGYSVALDGDTAVVGAPFDDLGANEDQGSAYVFVRSAATDSWTFQAKLTAADGSPEIAFGSDVAISGNTIVVGTSIILVSATTSANAEAAYVFVRSGGTWTQQQKLTAADGAPGEAFGSTVGISGETIVVGAPFHGAADRGAAYVFARAGGIWSRQQKLAVENPGSNDTHYGYSVAASGDTVIVGAPRYGSGGQIYAYVRSGSGQPTPWTLQQIMSSDETNVCDALGLEVALSGGTLIASTNRGLYTGAGCTILNGYSVYIFARFGATWTRQQKLHDSGVAVTDVAIFGDTAVFGTILRRPNSTLNETAAYVFTRTGTSWTPREPLFTGDDATSDGAADVAVFGNTVVVGATQDELDLTVNQDVDFTSHQGSAYIFNVPDAPACGFTLNPTSRSFSSTGGSGSFAVSTNSPNCSWIAESDSSWLIVTSGAGGTGNGTINYSVAANQTTEPRTGTINVSGQIFTVTQAGIVGTVMTVTNTNDSGAGSLREAVAQAVATTESRTILFDQTVFGSPQTITLASNLFISNSNGGTITITGPGANLLTISGAGGRRIFTITSNSVVEISGMTVTGGNGSGSTGSGQGGAIYNTSDLTLSDVVVSNSNSNSASTGGGGIFHTLRSLTLNDCVVSGNTTTGRGAGIYLDVNVTATISGTTVSNNTANGIGGGIFSGSSTTLILSGSKVTGNTTNIANATTGGGGIHAGSAFTMTDSIVSGNRAPNGAGGGISFPNSGTKSIVRSTISNNSAGASGGGINFSNTQISVTNSTISHNRAGGSGGGINRDNDAPQTQVFSYTTIAFNSAANTGGGVNTQAAIQFNNSLVGVNSAQISPDFAGAINSGGYNLIKDTSGATVSGTTTGNIIGVDPRLDGALRGSGGATKTLALRPGSPAIDAGNPSNPPATDQRSLTRPVDGDGNGTARADIGSYERQPNELVPPAPLDFDGDGRSDLSVFRPSDRNWYVLASADSQFFGTPFGIASDKLVPADYDGDGKTDIAVWRDEPSNPDKANFYILNSSNNSFRVEQFGRTGDQPSVSGDWDGDGRADLAVYRDGGAAGNQSYFFYRPSSQPGIDFVTVYWGTGGDRPMRGDFDGDGRADAAVFRPSGAVWYIRQSSDSQLKTDYWGLATDKFVPADYDGDGKTDPAVFRDGVWYIKQSSNSQPRYERFGLATDTLVPADYDGDGRADVAVFREGVWYLLGSQQGFSAAQFGFSNDRPIAAEFTR